MVRNLSGTPYLDLVLIWNIDRSSVHQIFYLASEALQQKFHFNAFPSDDRTCSQLEHGFSDEEKILIYCVVALMIWM